MRILLDECIPTRLSREFVEHEVRTVQQAGWSGLSNGRLLSAAERDFDVFLTVDQSLRYQQNVSGFGIAVVIPAARSNDIQDLRPLVPRVLAALAQLRPGQVLHVGERGD